MEKRQQQFSIGYFIVALGAIFALQFFLVHAPVATLGYSQFKALVKKAKVRQCLGSHRQALEELAQLLLKTRSSNGHNYRRS